MSQSPRKATTSLLISKQTIRKRQAEQEGSNQVLIRTLQEKNRRLKEQITNVLELVRRKGEEGKQAAAQAQTQVYKLIPNESSGDVVRKQLENAYKAIKMYESEIKKLESSTQNMDVTAEMSRLESMVKDKQKLIDKLKDELNKLNKSIAGNTKKLKDNSSQEQELTKVRNLNDEIKYLREKLRNLSTTDERKRENANKQRSYIRALEAKLVSLGFPQAELNRLQQGRAKSAREAKDEVQDRTSQHFQQIKKEIKVLNKLKADNNRRAQSLIQDKKNLQTVTAGLKNTLLAKVQEIEQLQRSIKETRSKVTKANMRPSFLVQDAKKLTQLPKKKKVQKPDSLRLEQAGQQSPGTIKFTDRQTLGKNYETNLSSLKIFYNKEGLCGVQCNYLYKDRPIAGQLHLLQAEEPCREETIRLEPDQYITTVGGGKASGAIKYLAFLSSKGRVLRVGENDPQAQRFELGRRIGDKLVCVTGSIDSKGSRLRQFGGEWVQVEVPPFQAQR